MTGQSRVTLSNTTAALAVGFLLAAGAGVTYLAMRGVPSAGHVPPMEMAAAGDVPARQDPNPLLAEGNARLPDVVVPLTSELADRAGIVVEPVAMSAGGPGHSIRLPGVVEPNAYRRIAVTSLVSGRITRVAAELGDRVRRGQTIAQVYSPELADAQSRYLAARARLEAHDRELQRTEKLVEIGAASRQELERIHAEHTAQTADVQTAQSRLLLLGMPDAAVAALQASRAVSATTDIPAPIDGVVIERTANVGLNVDLATALFTVVDLSSVWIVADVYESDFASVRVGGGATVTTPAYPTLVLSGRISYIDPLVDARSRTAKVRVEVPNPRGDLRLGMFVDVTVAAADRPPGIVIPRTAVQNVGDRHMVYLARAGEPGRFIEREVHLGQVSGDRVEVVAGLQAGDGIVTAGSFHLRAERERLGLRAGAGAEPAATSR